MYRPRFHRRVTTAPSPSSPARTVVALGDFDIEFDASGSSSSSVADITLATENYLVETMSREFATLTSIELTALQSRRRLQESVQTIQYLGNAVFDGTDAAPSSAQVLESQTVALEDTESLQMAYNTAGVDILVQQVVVQQPESTVSSSSMNTALIAGVSVAGVVVLALVALVAYKWWHNERDYNCKHVVHLNDNGPPLPPQEDFVKYTPDDFEPTTSPKSLSLNESATDIEQDVSAVEVDMDEYSLSAASVDSSVKKDPIARRESLLKKLALYQKSEKKPPAPEKIPMPTALFVPQVIPRDDSEMSLTVGDSPRSSPYEAAVRQVSLLDQSGNTSSGDETEEDLLPPPPPVPVSTGRSSQWALDTSDHQLVPSESPRMSQWSLSPQQPYVGEHDESYEVSYEESRLVPTTVRF